MEVYLKSVNLDTLKVETIDTHKVGIMTDNTYYYDNNNIYFIFVDKTKNNGEEIRCKKRGVLLIGSHTRPQQKIGDMK